MVGCFGHREAEYRDQMASGGFSPVLALAISDLRLWLSETSIVLGSLGLRVPFENLETLLVHLLAAA